VSRALVGILASLVTQFALACSTTARSPEAQGPTLTFPVGFAEGEGEGKDDLPLDGGTRAAADAAPELKPPDSVPDPDPLKVARQWEYEVIYDKGKLSIGRVRAMRFDKPVVTARQMGRFAIELWIGRELVDRVRFDFPLLAAEEPHPGPRRPLKDPPSIGAGARVSRTLLVPASPRATRAVLVDRATGETTALPWPPDAPIPPIGAERAAAGSDAGAAGANDAGS
jgi:hypothetical protein